VDRDPGKQRQRGLLSRWVAALTDLLFVVDVDADPDEDYDGDHDGCDLHSPAVVAGFVLNTHRGPLSPW
jgi:hypothetical protein